MQTQSTTNATSAQRGSRTTALTLACALVASIALQGVPTPAAAATCTDPGRGSSYGGGTGEADSPYLISTVAHLQALRDRVNENVSDTNQAGCHFLQTADLDLGGIDSWVAIGIADSTNLRFNGIYDGGYHVIENLTIKKLAGEPDNAWRYGLFGFARDGAVRNLRLTAVDIDVKVASTATDSLYVGALVAEAESSSASSSQGTPQGTTTISTVSVQGTVRVDYEGAGELYVGGVVGRSRRGTLVDDRIAFVGEIIGKVKLTSTSSSTRRANFGGLVGRTSSDSKLSLGYAAANMSVTVEAQGAAGRARPVYIGILTGSSSSSTSLLSELYAVGSINVVNNNALEPDSPVFSGAVGFIEDEDDVFIDIYFIDSLTDFDGGRVSGYNTSGLINVTALSDADMRASEPVTTMVGTGNAGRWVYNNAPGAPNPNGKWFLVLDASAAPFAFNSTPYTYPVFFWEIACVPGGPQPASCFSSSQIADSDTALSVVCSPVDPPVGATVTCTVTGGDAEATILWAAAADGTPFAGTGVTLGANGTGTFSFIVPRSALGRGLTVELVEWLRPVSFGTVGGPVPGSVPAGEGGQGTVLLFTLMLTLLAVALTGRRPQQGVGVAQSGSR